MNEMLKKLLRCVLLLLAVIVCFSPVHAQWINSVSIIPANPTSSDSIMVVADLTFPSASCDSKTTSVSINGNTIFGNALHCVGVLTVICSITDTFYINPLSAGTYTFELQVDAGALPAPCTPGIVPGPNSSTTFVVSPLVSTDEIGNISFIQYPNPASNHVYLEIDNGIILPLYFELFTIDGKLILRQEIVRHNDKIYVGSLAEGNYVARIINQKTSLSEKLITIDRP